MANGQQQQPAAVQSVRLGSRWYNAPPSSEDVATWFDDQPVHDGMDHSRYVSGVVLISAEEKFNQQRQKPNGDIMLVEQKRLVFVPYVRVDTRIAYFWDLCRQLDGIGVIEPVPVKRIEDQRSAYFNAHLPEGFFMFPVRNNTAQESVNRYVAATYRVAIYERESFAQRHRGEGATPILQGVGTKQTPLAKQYADDNALMKAETGAIGRALGVAGILVVGTGVATAEDMMEATTSVASEGAGPEQAALPAAAPVAAAVAAEGAPGAAVEAQDAITQPQGQEDADAALRERARGLQAEIERDHPEAWARYRAWWAEREFGKLSDLRGPALKGAVVKLERDLDDAKRGPEPASE